MYLRRNFQQITKEDENSGKVKLWKYEEAKIPQEEYAPFDTVVMEVIRAEIDAIAAEQGAVNEAMSLRADDLENATCEQSENVEARLTDIEVALCDLSEQIAGAMTE